MSEVKIKTHIQELDSFGLDILESTFELSPAEKRLKTSRIHNCITRMTHHKSKAIFQVYITYSTASLKEFLYISFACPIWQTTQVYAMMVIIRHDFYAKTARFSRFSIACNVVYPLLFVKRRNVVKITEKNPQKL